MKKILLASLMTGSLLLLSGCGAPCNEQVLKDKMQIVTEKMQKIAESGDISKLMSLGKYSKELSGMQGANKDNLEPVCKAVDKLIAELDK